MTIKEAQHVNSLPRVVWVRLGDEIGTIISPLNEVLHHCETESGEWILICHNGQEQSRLNCRYLKEIMWGIGGPR